MICRKYYQTEKKCFYCQKTVVFKGLTIVSDEETIKEIVMKNKSISRFGDGEFKVMNGLGAGFQKPNKKLAKSAKFCILQTKLSKKVKNTCTNQKKIVLL